LLCRLGFNRPGRFLTTSFNWPSVGRHARETLFIQSHTTVVVTTGDRFIRAYLLHSTPAELWVMGSLHMFSGCTASVCASCRLHPRHRKVSLELHDVENAHMEHGRSRSQDCGLLKDLPCGNAQCYRHTSLVLVSSRMGCRNQIPNMYVRNGLAVFLDPANRNHKRTHM
jgi:hypothetical protein